MLLFEIELNSVFPTSTWIYSSNGAILGRAVKEGKYGRCGFYPYGGLCGWKEIRGSLIIIRNLRTWYMEESGINSCDGCPFVKIL